MNAYQFFMKHAGYSYDPKTETPMQGRIKCARELAKAERAARDGGFSYQWEIDTGRTSADWIEAGQDGSHGHSPWGTWQCSMYDAQGRTVAGLCGIDFGRDKEPWGDPYRRVVEAELAIDGLTNTPQGKE